MATSVLLLQHDPVSWRSRLPGSVCRGSVGAWRRSRLVADWPQSVCLLRGGSLRTAEYVAAMRRLWADDVATYSGSSFGFDSVRPYPNRDQPVPILGGTATPPWPESRCGDRWYGLDLAERRPLNGPGATATLRRNGRDPAELIMIAPFAQPTPSRRGPASLQAALGVEVVGGCGPPPAP